MVDLVEIVTAKRNIISAICIYLPDLFCYASLYMYLRNSGANGRENTTELTCLFLFLLITYSFTGRSTERDAVLFIVTEVSQDF